MRPSDNARNRECRDPVHGFIKLSKAEWAIVDCPTFQRLRDIRQLAMAHLVYPGATHTRFEHSLGCMHLSSMIFKAVKRRGDERAHPHFARAFGLSDQEVDEGHQIVCLAGLLHDLGHTPFSHSGEHLMPELEENGKKRRRNHEDMTAQLIRESEIADVLKQNFGDGTNEIVEQVIAVATEPDKAQLPGDSNREWYRFLNEILTGELGSDRMDYLLRDALHSGQSVGLFDHHKLIESMVVVGPPEETGEPHRLGLDEAGWLIGEQMVASRYLMYVALYFHKTKRIYEHHLESFLERWLEERYGEPHFPVGNLSEYARLTDSTVWAAIYDAAQRSNSKLSKLARPFVDRSHLRLTRELVLADNFLPHPTQNLAQELFTQSTGESKDKQEGDSDAKKRVEQIRGRLRDELRSRRARVWDQQRFENLVDACENHVRLELGGDFHFDETKHQAAKFFGSRDKIWVYLNGETRYLDELSEIVSGIPDKIWRGRIYASQDKRESLRHFCDQWLKEHASSSGETDDAAAQ